MSNNLLGEREFAAAESVESTAAESTADENTADENTAVENTAAETPVTPIRPESAVIEFPRSDLYNSDLYGALPISTPGAQDQEWHDRALCAQTDPEAFFPEKGGSTREAKKICTGCEVRAECLSYALAHDERFGIWGGLSERERRRLKRRAV